MSSVEIAQWTGAYAVTELVGRQNKLGEVFTAIESADSASQLVFITGEGGIGKTRLLRAAIEQLSHQQQVYKVATDLVDLYDLAAHSVVGLTERIVTVLSPSGDDFARYRQISDTLTRSEATGISDEERDLHEEIASAFVADLDAFAADQRVVIALDTAERMAYAAEIGEPSATVAQGWRWLASQIPHMRHVTWLIAGRERETRELLKLVPAGVARTDVLLDQLDEESSISYFDAAAAVAHENGDSETAEQLATLPREFRQQAYRYANGRPLLLALLADLWLMKAPPAQTPRDDGRPAYLPDAATEQALVSRLLETPGMGTFLLAAGRLRKGFDVALMIETLKVFQPHVTRVEVEDRFKKFRKLSFVKQRDDKLFLHDVMYEMLDAQVYRKPADRQDAVAVYDAMIAYNSREQQQLRDAIDAAYRPVEVERHAEGLNRDVLVKLNYRRHALLTERLYYLLRREAVRGFRHYFRATFDAVLSSDVTLDVALEAELLAFLNERDPQRQNPFVDGLERAVCEGVALLRPVARQFAAGQYDKAIEQAEALRQRPKALMIGGSGTEAFLGIWEAYARIYRAASGDMDQAKALLDHAIETLITIVNETDANHPSRLWRARGGLAFGYMVRGYLHWSRGALEEATDDYAQSVDLGRELRVSVNLATAENDLGFVRAEAGDTDDARQLVEQALRRRRDHGPRAPVAFSRNTIGLIDIREGRYGDAIEESSLSFSTFSALGHKRGETLALIALAEAKRRHGTNASNLEPDQRIGLLEEASQHAYNALQLAETLGERLRQVEALIEIGCAARDKLRLAIEHGAAPEDVFTALHDESSTHLQKAAELAGELFMYRKLDALVNLGYLHFYARDEAQTQAAIKRAERAFPPEYRLVPATGAPAIPRDRAHVQLWVQLGKLYTLRGHIAFDHYRATGSQQSLREATESYLLSLKYNSLYSPDHPGMRLMRQQVEERLQKIRPDLRRVVENVSYTEQKYHIPDSELRRLVRRMQWTDPQA